jgi:hypothetical protein
VDNGLEAVGTFVPGDSCPKCKKSLVQGETCSYYDDKPGCLHILNGIPQS